LETRGRRIRELFAKTLLEKWKPIQITSNHRSSERLAEDRKI
jgi:hypothetical protein